ncbi:MAG: DUF192 domain-containing protein [Planctomycetota bacterium]
MIAVRRGFAGFTRSVAWAGCALLLAVSCLACSRESQRMQSAGQPQDALLTVAGRSVHVELALTETQRNHGLKNRTELAEDAGMLFIFPDAGLRRFWMQDTLIPLDIIFLDADGTVQNIERGEPYVEQPGYHSRRAARMVLELKAGWSDQAGLKPGDRILVPPELLALAR